MHISVSRVSRLEGVIVLQKCGIHRNGTNMHSHKHYDILQLQLCLMITRSTDQKGSGEEGCHHQWCISCSLVGQQHMPLPQLLLQSIQHNCCSQLQGDIALLYVSHMYISLLEMELDTPTSFADFHKTKLYYT